MYKSIIIIASIIPYFSLHPFHPVVGNDGGYVQKTYSQGCLIATTEKYSSQWWKQLMEHAKIYLTIKHLVCKEIAGKFPIFKAFLDWYEDEFRLTIGNPDEYLNSLVDRVEQNNFLVTRIFLMYKVNPDSNNQNFNILFHANSTQMAQLLIQYGANPLKADKNNWTLLHKTVAAPQDTPELISLYLKKEIKADVCTTLGRTPLHVLMSTIKAYEHNNKIPELNNKLALLLQAQPKPNINIWDKKLQTPLDILNKCIFSGCIHTKTNLQELKEILTNAGAKTYQELESERDNACKKQ
jgi:hypothetical protein